MTEEANDPIDPTDARDAVADLLLVLSAGAGIAGCLMWEVGVAFYFVPLGLAAFALTCLIGSLTIANRVRLGTAVIAALALLGSGWIGIDKKGELDGITERAAEPFDNVGQYP